MVVYKKMSIVGIKIHSKISSFLRGKITKDDSFILSEISKFISANELTFVKSEERVVKVIEGLRICGKFDALFIDSVGRHVLVDWKFTEYDVVENEIKNFSSFNTIYGNATLQLNLYSYMLGLKDSIKIIVVLRKNNVKFLRAYDMNETFLKRCIKNYTSFCT